VGLHRLYSSSTVKAKSAYAWKAICPIRISWRAAAHYKAANCHTAPRTVAEDLRSTYPSSVGRARRLRDCINNAEVESVFDSQVAGYTEVGPNAVCKDLIDPESRPTSGWRVIQEQSGRSISEVSV
jgi:hypothetical protein